MMMKTRVKVFENFILNKCIVSDSVEAILFIAMSLSLFFLSLKVHYLIMNKRYNKCCFFLVLVKLQVHVNVAEIACYLIKEGELIGNNVVGLFWSSAFKSFDFWCGNDLVREINEIDF